MTTGRETRINILRVNARKHGICGPRPKAVILCNDKAWGRNRSSAMSQIKSQASNRKLPITLPKINLPE